MEIDLDALFPKGAVDDATRKEVLLELLRNTRQGLTRRLREAIFLTLLTAASLAFALWSLFKVGATPWFWGPVGLIEGVLMVVWAWIWTVILRYRDTVDETMSDVRKWEPTNV